MADAFTPLTPASLSSGGATPAATFKPLPTAASGTPSAGNAAASAGCAGKPVITLQRKGNVVTSIRVQCTCGQVIDINCQY